jgi:acetyl esterase/lipase
LSPPPKHPLLINLHGGGFSIGHARDDARFLTHITSSLSCVAVSIDYRLAPTYPFPTAIEDIISSILYLWEHAEEFGIDTEETVITGFSAGGFLAYSVVIGLEDMLKKRKEEGKDRVKGRVKGLVVFYGGCDYTSTRAEKDASNPNLIPVIPPSLYRFFDRSYLQGNPDKTSPLLTPGLAPREALRRAMPETIVMINCGGDQLLAESLRFGERLRSLGKRVEGMVIEGEGHAWDKKPSFKKGNVKRDEAYDFAVKNLKHIWGFKK